MKRIVSILTVSLVVVGLGAGTWFVSSLPEMATRPSGRAPARAPGIDPYAPLTDPDSLVGSLVGSAFPGGWNALDGESVGSPRLEVEQLDETSWRVVLEIPGFLAETIHVGGRTATRVLLPGIRMLRRAGLPEVPVLATNLPVAAGADLRVRVVDHDVREITMPPVVPSVGHIDRRRDPASAPVIFSDFYADGGVWPPSPYVLGAPFQLRDLHGVNLRLQPVRYDASRRTLQVSRRIELEITSRGGQTGAKSGGLGPDDEFADVYSFAFGNMTASARRAGEKYASLPTRGRMLIVTDASFVDDLQPLRAWKLRRGIETEIVTTNFAGKSPTALSAFLQDRYDEPAGLTWVVLVGDREVISPHTGLYDGSDSDSRYALLAGADDYPDIFVSRISATTSQQVRTQVAKFIAYEKFTGGGDGKWLRRAVGIASDEGDPTDSERMEEMRADLLDAGFDAVDRQYQGLGGSRAGIRTAIESGSSLVNYLGHGTGISWTSVPFTNLDVAGLENPDRWPWIVDVSCSNGDFALDPCFAEVWLQAGTPDDPRGAVAVVSATSDAPWVPPTVMQQEIVDLLVSGRAVSIGSLYYGGLMKVLDLYAGLPVALRVFEQNVVFGDCSLQVRSTPPGTFTITGSEVLDGSAALWSLQVGAWDGVVEGAVVALTGPDELYGAGVVASDGAVTVPLAIAPSDGQLLDVTITGPDMIPYLGTVAVGGDQVAPADSESGPGADLPTVVRLLGNRPNPFNPTTRIEFELPRSQHVRVDVYDIRGRRIARLLDETLPAGRGQATWSARDDAGRPVASGIYLYRLQSEDAQLTGRMTLGK